MADDDAIDPGELRELIAKQKIAEVMALYCRGIDRCDLDALTGVFWSDAVADYGSGPQNAHAWARNTVAALTRMRRTMHSIGNILVELDGERARAETYCHAYHEVDGPDGPLELVVGGRYLDHLERRDGTWRIAQRTYVLDWNRNIASSSKWDEGLYAGLRIRGARHPDDPLYRSA